MKDRTAPSARPWWLERQFTILCAVLLVSLLWCVVHIAAFLLRIISPDLLVLGLIAGVSLPIVYYLYYVRAYRGITWIVLVALVTVMFLIRLPGLLPGLQRAQPGAVAGFMSWLLGALFVGVAGYFLWIRASKRAFRFVWLFAGFVGFGGLIWMLLVALFSAIDTLYLNLPRDLAGVFVFLLLYPVSGLIGVYIVEKLLRKGIIKPR